jgi:hypothetical protein
MVRAPRRLVLFAAIALAGCSAPEPEDPSRTALRDRLRQDAQLESAELDQLRSEVLRSMGDQVFAIQAEDGTRPIPAERQAAVFGMLKDPSGVFDEGLRNESGHLVRVLNAPGLAPSSEIDAARRLFIDVETLLPRRFDFSYGFPSPENYTYELVAGR